MAAQNLRSRRWVWTLNNYTQEDLDHLATLFSNQDRFKYVIYGREEGESGTQHLQGFTIFQRTQRLAYCRSNIHPRAHYEVALGNNQQAADYCKKEGNFVEFGACPNNQGRRTDLVELQEWITQLDAIPSERDIARRFPTLWLRYHGRVGQLIGHLLPEQPLIVGGELQQWQQQLHDDLRLPPNDREIQFYVDYAGNKGKSWFCSYMYTTYPNEVQILSVGRRDDIAHTIDATKSIFLFDVPRGGMEHFQYAILEMMKNRVIFSPKYQSTVKLLNNTPHVVVFCNEEPAMNALSEDRYVVHNL